MSQEDAVLLSREELIALVTRAHLGSASADSSLAGKTLAAQSKLPQRVAENLGAGFGQWDFFPEIADIVDFALAYAPPATEDDVWKLARAWAADDAASRHTLMNLVGREILQHELRRIDVPKLRELIEEGRPERARELRASLGLDVPPSPKAKAARAPREPSKKRASPESAPDTPRRMPKPEFKRPPKAPPPPEAKRFQHPKFGEGVLQSQDGDGPDAKLTIKFEGEKTAKTLLARYVTAIES
jgi:hypothetical protein